VTTLRATIGSGFNRVPRWVYVAIALLLAILFPLLEQAGLMNPVWMRVGTRTLVYVMLAIGLNVVMGETGLLNLGYVAFFAVGAYTTAIFASPRFGYEIPFFLLLVLSAVMAMALGAVVGLPTLRLRGDYLAIVTLAFGEITRHAFNNLDTVTNGPGGIPGIYPPNIFGWIVDRPVEFYYLFLVFVVIFTILLTNLKKSRTGRAWNALREDEIAADHMGVHGTRAKMLSMIISAGIAGIAGSLFAYYQTFINPTYFEFIQSVIVVCMVVLGGMGSIPGVILGAVVLDTLPEAVRQGFTSWLPAIVGEDFMATWPRAVQTFFTEFDRYRMLIVGALIVIMVIFRPEGLLPDKLWRREAHDEDPRDQERTKQSLFDVEEGKQDLEV
jgi:branched-chain amino acid transport system permease protein